MSTHYEAKHSVFSFMRRHNSTGHDDPSSHRRHQNRHAKVTTRRFSVLESTEDNHKTLECQFLGSYGHIRKALDYEYHSFYKKSRQWLHDSIIDDHLHDDQNNPGNLSVLPVEPILILTVGVQGAGKHYSLYKLTSSGRLPLLSSVRVDPDEISRLLPEYHLYVEESPHQVDALTRKESGYIAETLTLAILQANRNVVLDCLLENVDWYKEYVARLRKTLPSLKVALIHVTADPGRILDRVKHRARETRRDIPEEVIKRRLEVVTEEHVNRMKGHVDFFGRISNEDCIDVVEGDWQEFHDFFSQKGTEAPKLVRLRTVDMHSKGRRPGRRFSVIHSTEENHKADDPDAFFGPYAHIRKTLDYSYHSNYTFTRQRFQDAIIGEFIDSALFEDMNGVTCTTPTDPWLVFTAGAMGAGKSYTLRKVTERGQFPLLAFVRVDPDEIRRYFPEFKLYVDQSPELAGELTRKEAGFISEILTMAALESGKNVLVDGSLRDTEWYKKYFQRLRMNYDTYRLAIIYVSAPRDVVFQRAAERAMTTGRIVPRETLERVLEQVPRSVGVLSPLVDYYVELSNVDKIKLANPEGETWESFTGKWIQTCAWVPTKKQISRAESKSSLPDVS